MHIVRSDEPSGENDGPGGENEPGSKNEPPGNESEPGNESGPGSESGPGNESEPGNESGPGSEKNPVLLLTGATGQVGSALLRRLVDEGEQVRCLVRDPRRLGTMRVRVQIALGDLADPPSFRNALRGVDTVVHLAAAIRDQPRGSIEELNGIATWRLVRAAQNAGAKRFIFFSALDASPHHRTRFHRAKALAEQAVRESELDWTVFAPSIVYAPGDQWLTMLERLSLLPVMPVSGMGRARYQPIWAQDAAACTMAVLRDRRGGGDDEEGERDGDGRAEGNRDGEDHAEGERDGDGRAEGSIGGGEHGGPHSGKRYELAGPQTLSHLEIVALVLDSLERPRPIVRVPTPIVSRGLRLMQATLGRRAPVTWDEAELMECSMVASAGASDAEALMGRPKAMAEVLG